MRSSKFRVGSEPLAAYDIRFSCTRRFCSERRNEKRKSNVVMTRGLGASRRILNALKVTDQEVFSGKNLVPPTVFGVLPLIAGGRSVDYNFYDGRQHYRIESREITI